MASHDARSSSVGGSTIRRHRIEVRTTLSYLAILQLRGGNFKHAVTIRLRCFVGNGVTVGCLGTDFESIYESDLARLDGIRELADTVTPARVVIDLSQTRYSGAVYIGFLMARAGRLKDRGNGQIGIFGVQSFPAMVRESTKADTLLGLFDGIDHAVAALRPTDSRRKLLLENCCWKIADAGCARGDQLAATTAKTTRKAATTHIATRMIFTIE